MAADALLRGLARTEDDEVLVTAILGKAKVGAGTLRVGRATVTFGPVGDPGDYAEWPASFREFVATIGAIRVGDSLAIGEGADGGLDGLKHLLRGTELAKHEAKVRCPVEQVPDWWIYPPLDGAAHLG